MSTRPDLRPAVPTLEAESELLSREPPPQALRILTDVILGLFLVTAAFVALVRLPSAAHGRFELRPVGGAAPVDAPWPAYAAPCALSASIRSSLLPCSIWRWL